MRKLTTSRLAVLDNGEDTIPAQAVTISPPNFKTAVFEVVGDPGVPLVVCRMSEKIGEQPKAGEKRKRRSVTPDEQWKSGRYISSEGWEGVPTSFARNSMIAACRFADAKQVNAKGAIFIEADGSDKYERQTSLIRVHGVKAVRQDDTARNKFGAAVDCHRPAYYDWAVTVRVRFDADQFTLEAIANLLQRAGCQIGWGVGRPSSSRSNGMCWGTFTIKEAK